MIRSSKLDNDHMINIINIYAPTSEKVKEDQEEVETLYREVENLINTLKKNKSSVIFVAGDFNSKIGKRKDGDEAECLGKYSVGERNLSGELLMDFCKRNELFLCNTAFQHPVKHITTWSQQRIEKKDNKVRVIFNQIDYILIHSNQKQNIRNARTYAGTETSSDHKLLVLDFEADWVKLYRKVNRNKEEIQKRFNTNKLITDTDAREEYQIKLREEAEKVDTWEELSEVCKKTAEEKIG